MITSINRPSSRANEYPGTYNPPTYNWTKVMRQLKKNADENTKPSLAIYEDPNCYSIEIQAPGYSKEDFMVTLEGDRLSVYGLCPSTQSGEQYSYHLVDACSGCFEHSIHLPENIDSDFVRAEYKSGLLRLDFPKSERQNVRTVDKIVVY